MNRDIAKPSRGMVQPTFLIVSGILLLSAIAFNGFVWNLKLHFKKDPVAQPRDFREMPALMGHWLQVSQDDKLDKETEDVLGTEKYIYRDYVQVDRAGADLVAYLASRPDLTGPTTQPTDLDPNTQPPKTRRGRNSIPRTLAAASGDDHHRAPGKDGHRAQDDSVPAGGQRPFRRCDSPWADVLHRTG